MLRRRVLLVVVAVLLLVVGVSWGRAITKAGPESFAARNAEWMRDNHLGFIIDRVEQYQLAHDQPKLGGAPDKSLLHPAVTEPQLPSSHSAPAPAPMRTPAASAFAGEGQWAPEGPTRTDGTVGVYTTRVRSNAKTTSLLVFVARIDPRFARVRLVPGTELPGGSWSHPPQVTAQECPTAILALNGGFRFDQAQGGWYSDGRAAPDFPLVDGAASLVTFKDGSIAVGQWGRDLTAKDLPKIDTVRQNLQLLVDGGSVVPTIDDGPKWGARLRNSLFVWRSGYGATADGQLVYVGGPGLTPRDLAERLVDAGAVKGMQGDINPQWVAANLYHDSSTGCHGTKGLDTSPDKGGQQSSGDRYLSTDTRDFIEVLAKSTP